MSDTMRALMEKGFESLTDVETPDGHKHPKCARAWCRVCMVYEHHTDGFKAWCSEPERFTHIQEATETITHLMGG